MEKTDIRTEGFTFKDNVTFLNQSNWQNFFTSSLKNGFDSLVGRYNQSTSKFEISNTYGMLEGLRFYPDSAGIIELDLVTQAEFSVLVYLYFDVSSNSVKLAKVTGFAQDEYTAFYMLSDILQRYSAGLAMAQYIIKYYTGISTQAILPIAYGIYGHGYYDLTRIAPSNEAWKVYKQTQDQYDTSVAIPYIGNVGGSGIVQVYGATKYQIDLAADYTLGEFRLFPVPAVSMDAAEIYIKNNTSGSVTIKLPLTYRDMYFSYLTDANWTENSGFMCYTLTAGNDMYIKMTQAMQDIITSGGVNYPKSVYAVTQMASA